jgi:SAM-dependent methyltransferase
MPLREFLSNLGPLARPRQRTGSLDRDNSRRTVFSFVIDTDPRFAYQGYHLARSLIEHCGGDPAAVHAQFTPEVPAATRELFAELGCTLDEVARFGDGRYCNKVGQLRNLLTGDFACAVLLDTDMIAVADLRPYLDSTVLQAKIVDLANPSITALQEIARRAGMPTLRARVGTEAGDGDTWFGNCNGGFYAIPKALCSTVDAAWRQWTLWLLANIDLLAREGKEGHADQVAMWLAIHMARIPFRPAPSNINYFVHLPGGHCYFDRTREIALIHYHDSLNVLGLLEPPIQLNDTERSAIAKANCQIKDAFENRLFWDLRYSHFGDRGSGVGSRGENLLYKRDLLRREGVEEAASVLDVGCGDLEVLKVLEPKAYLGIDCSETALALARQARPDWQFQVFSPDQSRIAIAPKQFVICLEVLIHQPTAAAYESLIEFLADHTLQTLIVSGYDRDDTTGDLNHMLFFHEPLETSLVRTGRFKSIRQIGRHTSVTIFRCDV